MICSQVEASRRQGVNPTTEAPLGSPSASPYVTGETAVTAGEGPEASGAETVREAGEPPAGAAASDGSRVAKAAGRGPLPGTGVAEVDGAKSL